MAKLNVDFRLLDARAELPALRDSVQTLEDQLEFLAAQRRQQVLADLGRDADEAEVQIAFQGLRYEVEYTYPRVYRGSLLLVIWAAYESAVVQVADFLRACKNIDLRLSEVRGRGVVEQAKIYYPKILGFPLFTSDDNAGRIGEVARLRNAFAHAAGRVAGLTSGPRKAARAWEERGWVDKELGYLVPTKTGLEAVLGVVDAEVSGLIERALAWDDSRHSNRPEADPPPSGHGETEA